MNPYNVQYIDAIDDALHGLRNVVQHMNFYEETFEDVSKEDLKETNNRLKQIIRNLQERI